MTNTQKALQALWESFGLPAYPEENVPSDAQLPYITYTVIQPGHIDWTSHQARVWYKSTGYAQISAKVDEILNHIGYQMDIQTDGGWLCMYPGNPVAQYQPIDKADLKVAYLNFDLYNYQWEG